MARKKKQAAFDKVLLEILRCPLGEESEEAAKNIPGVEPTTTHDEAIARALIAKAMKGDAVAAKYIAETVKGMATDESDLKLVLKIIR